MEIMALTSSSSSNKAQHLPSPVHGSSAVAATIPRDDTQMCDAEMLKACAAAPSDPKLQECGSEISKPKILLKLKRRKTEAEEAVSKMMTEEKEALVLPGARKQSKRKRAESVRWFKIPIGLTHEEIKVDLSPIFESKPPQQVSRRPREVKAALDSITPGSWLRSARISMKK